MAAFEAPGGEGDWNVAEAIGHAADSRAGLSMAGALAATGRFPSDASPVVQGVPGERGLGREALVRRIAVSQRIVERAARSIAGHEADPCPLEHPQVGRLRCGEWLLFAGVHDLMHLEQLHGIAGRVRPAGRGPRAVSARPDLVACWLFRLDPAGRPEILLIRRAPDRMYPGLWQCVTGKLEAGEAIAAAALREVAEETGLGAADLEAFYETDLVNWFHEASLDALLCEAVFAARVRTGAEVSLSHEHDDARWLPVDGGEGARHLAGLRARDRHRRVAAREPVEGGRLPLARPEPDTTRWYPSANHPPCPRRRPE